MSIGIVIGLILSVIVNIVFAVNYSVVDDNLNTICDFAKPHFQHVLNQTQLQPILDSCKFHL